MKRAFWISAFSGVLLGITSYGTVGCGQDAGLLVSATGRVEMALTGTSSSGITYRLRDATFLVTGTSAVTLATEPDPDADAISVGLGAGEYLIELQSGWRLESEAPGGEFTPSRGVLVSDNPVAFSIRSQETTAVRFRFSVGDEVAELGNGRLDLGVDISDGQGGAGGTGGPATGGTSGFLPDTDSDGVPDAEDCNPNSAEQLASLPDGSCGSPAASCLDLLLAYPSAPSQTYLLRLGGELVVLHCLMTEDGGGWTLIANFPTPEDASGVPGWNSGETVGSSFTDLARAFKLSDLEINALRTTAYRVHGTATVCNDGPCAIDTKLFWGSDCEYSSSARNPGCGNAFLDPELTLPSPAGTDTTAADWHWGLVSANNYPTIENPIINAITTSHEGDGVVAGTLDSETHSFSGRFPENPSLMIWVR